MVLALLGMAAVLMAEATMDRGVDLTLEKLGRMGRLLLSLPL